MGKVSIYIPDDKSELIEEWKGKGMNLSKLFMDAFHKAIEIEEAVTAMDDTKLQETVRRLKLDQEEDFNAGKKVGVKDGATWASDNASLVDLRRVAEDEVDQGDIMKMLLDVWGEAYIRDLGDGFDEDAFMDGYTKGFIEGASSVWKQVRVHL